MTIVYDVPDTLEFGVLYASDEAYRNPKSVLSLPQVTFELIDQARFKEVQRNSPRNVVRLLHNSMGMVEQSKTPHSGGAWAQTIIGNSLSELATYRDPRSAQG